MGLAGALEPQAPTPPAPQAPCTQSAHDKKRPSLDQITLAQLDAQFATRMQAIASGYPEEDHIQADALLVELLHILELKELAEAYDRITKWYA